MLVVALDSLDPPLPGGTRSGEAANIYLDDQLAAGVTIGARGAVQTVDLDLARAHSIAFIRGPTANPAAASAGDLVYLFAEASDTFGHPLSYLWTADCPGPSDGSFDNPASNSPIWTAPALNAATSQECVLHVLAQHADLQGEQIQSSLVMSVAPAQTFDPVPVIQANPSATACGGEITFDGSSSFHGNPGSHLQSFEWDFAYDGNVFSPDASGVTAAYTYPGQAGDRTAALRVTDDGIPPRSAIASVSVHPGTLNRAPIADAGGPYLAAAEKVLVLNGAASADPDAACGDGVAGYAWDLDGDAVFDDADGANPSLSWADVVNVVCGGACVHGQSYPIALEVTDAAGASHAAGSTITPDLVIFSDTFDDGNSSGDVHWQVLSGAWTVSGAPNPYYASALTTKVDTTVVKDIPVTGFAAGRLEVKLALTKKFRISANGAVIFAYRDATHYRYVRLSKSTAWKLSLGQKGIIGPDGAGVKASKSVTGLAFLKWYPLWVDVYSNGTIKVFLKTRVKPVLSFKFKAAAAGMVGLNADRALSNIDDFIVWEKGVLP